LLPPEPPEPELHAAQVERMSAVKIANCHARTEGKVCWGRIGWGNGYRSIGDKVK
jgi:hypothetical protein